jgi:hypothetical protein
MRRLLRLRSLLTLLTLLTLTTLVVTIVDHQSERNSLVEIQDTLNQRLVQMVNGDAVVQSAAGTGATASVDGNDSVGQVNITTGASPVAGSLIHVKFVKPYATQPFVIVNPEDAPPPAGWYVTIDTNGWDIWVGTAPKPNTNYPFAYFIAARPWLMYLGAGGQPVGADGTPDGR